MFLNEKFKIKDLGHVNYFLGLQNEKVEQGMIVHQHRFANELMSLYSMQDYKTVPTPLPSKLKLLPQMDNPLKDPSSYKQLIGKLNFLVHTRPDLAFTVQFLSHFIQNPCQADYDATLHVLQYVKGTLYQGLLLKNNQDFDVQAYCDYKWAT